MILAPGQIRAARAFLSMSQRNLSQLSGVSEPTIKRMENDNHGPGKTTAHNAEAVRRALEDAGIIFTETDGRLGVIRRSEMGLAKAS